MVFSCKKGCKVLMVLSAIMMVTMGIAQCNPMEEATACPEVLCNVPVEVEALGRYDDRLPKVHAGVCNLSFNSRGESVLDSSERGTKVYCFGLV